MGASIRCARCNKGISDRDKWLVLYEASYHAKCAQRVEKGSQQIPEPLVNISGLSGRVP